MNEPAPNDRGGRGRVPFWAGVRLVLGLAQMTGAVTTLFLLAYTGVSSATLIALAVTTGCTIVSNLLFRRSAKVTAPQ